MCLLFFHFAPLPKEDGYKLILVNNRDEFYDRPTKSAHFWGTDPNILAGMDNMANREGGTWLGMTESGKIGVLLNIFQSATKVKISNGASRGFLVVDFLRQNFQLEEYVGNIINSDVKYSPFNLILLDHKAGSYESVYYNNQENKYQVLEPGTHSFGNSLRSRPFEKVVYGKKVFENIIRCHGKKRDQEKLIEKLLEMMQNTTEMYPDGAIISQGSGYSEAFLKGLSRIWVSIPTANYGTRTTTVVLVDASSAVTYYERTMREPVSVATPEWDISKFNFIIRKDC